MRSCVATKYLPFSGANLTSIADDALGILQGERGFGPDGLFFEGSVEALQFSVGLRVVGRTEHVGGLPVADELLEVFGHEL